ncbi:hypothetical protein [Butyrivibrio sp. XPD2002]|uniref:hypothetical protein n=1 Tax=Butyrivibrio sp. XPD2002 TaxID=1280665 RepID=UPI0003F544DE|nr:hypothetical protein [Butyrivibrio sp. XPD2002]
MSFVISNRTFSKAQKEHDIYYRSKDNYYNSGGVLAFCATNAYGARLQKFVECIGEIVKKPGIANKISDRDFYLVVKYSVNENKLYIQTDFIGSHTCYLYQEDGFFFISNNLVEMIKDIQSTGRKVYLDERETRKFVYAGYNYTEKTIFKNITIVPPATNVVISITDGMVNSLQYEDYRFKGEINSEEEAASRLYGAIDLVFADNYSNNTKYGLGVSGGLDSRVAGYFANKHNYKIVPYFLGREKNALGIRTNDACRSIEVADALGIGDVAFINNTGFEYKKRLIGDALHAPIGSPNVAQNIGYDWKNFDVLIHGMMGGELFGGISFLQRKDPMDAHDIAAMYLNSLNCVPKSTAKYSIHGKIFNQLPVIKERYHFNQLNQIITDDISQELEDEIERIIKRDLDNGLSQTNALFKLFLYKQSKNVITGYYSTIEGTVPSLGVYFNPVVLSEMTNWSDDLFYERKVQKSLINMCGSISEVRDQTMKSSISNGYQNRNNYFNIAERVIRGSGMYYDTYPLTSFDETLKELETTKTVQLFKIDYRTIMLSKSTISDLILKIAWLEKELSLEYI